MRRRVAILGSTGSIGTQALEVIESFPERFEVVGLAAGKNVARLVEQARRFQVKHLSLAQQTDAEQVKAAGLEVASVGFGGSGLIDIATTTGAEVVLVATDGMVAFEAAFAAIQAGIHLAVANKELLVSAGELLMPLAKAHNVHVLPVDSEHSAIFQCLQGEDPATVDRIILTASGGPFRTWSKQDLDRVQLQDAMAHPTWVMGIKNTIDSATLMNKGLEVIEASRLFGLSADQIDVVVHPTSFVHAFVLFRDGNLKAQLALPDMKLPIGYALGYPQRLIGREITPSPDPLTILGAPSLRQPVSLAFEAADVDRFPALALAYQALRAGGTVPCVLSAANEIAVDAFARGALGFRDIPRIVDRTMRMIPRQELSLTAIAETDLAARAEAQAQIAEQRTKGAE